MESPSETIKHRQSELFTSSSGSPQEDRARKRSLLMVAATGLGKTVMMGAIAATWPESRILLITHRFELNKQAQATLEQMTGEEVDLEQGMFQADRYGSLHRVVVASVQSLVSKRKRRPSPGDPRTRAPRMEKFDPAEFGLIMIDEAHRSTAKSYREVVDWFRSENPNIKVVGVTATPDRLDGVGMHNMFDDVVCDYNIEWGMKNGYLVEPRQKFVQINGLDYSQIRTVAGDLDKKQLIEVVEAEQVLHEMAVPIVDVAGEHDQGIIFCASVAHARALEGKLRDYYHRKYGTVKDASEIAISIDGSLPPMHPERQRLVKRFKNAEVQFLCNCGVATEGFDAPNVKLIAIGRPTKSRALYTQMLGRGTRPLPGIIDGLPDAESRKNAIAESDKKFCQVLDFVGNSGRHKLICATDILAGKSIDEAEVEQLKEWQKKNTSFDGDMQEAIEKMRAEEKARREAERLKATVKVDYSMHDVQGAVHSFKDVKDPTPGYMRLRVPRASEKQVNFLVKLGYKRSEAEKINRQHASKAIEHAVHNPKTSTARWLRKKWIEEGKISE